MSDFLRVHRLQIILIVYFVFTTFALFNLLPNWGNDDPYITYRYARNLYNGEGFVFNPGEYVLSTTTPLFTLILAAARIFVENLPRVANLIGSASLSAGALFLWDISRQSNHVLVGWAALLLYPTSEVLVRTLGSETPLYLVLCLGAIAFYLREKYTITALLLALAFLTRGDAVVLGVVLAVDWLIKHPFRTLHDLRALPWTAIGSGSAILFAWSLFAIPYFGSPLPVTLAAKQAQGLMNISEKFAPGLWTTFRPYFSYAYFWVEMGLMSIGFFTAFRQKPWWLMVGWAVGYFLAYTILGVTRYFWYYAPLVPAIVVLIGLGLETLQQFAGRVRVDSRILSGAIMLILAGVAVPQALSISQLPRYPDERLGAYKMVGEWLAQNTPPQTSIGALEVGVIGYYAAPRPMVDFAGLIQPEVVHLFAPEVTYADTTQWAIMQFKPELIVLHEGWFPELERTIVAEHCTSIKTFPGKKTGYSYDLKIYQCQYP